jgi:ATP-dependent DNA ligase
VASKSQQHEGIVAKKKAPFPWRNEALSQQHEGIVAKKNPILLEE